MGTRILLILFFTSGLSFGQTVPSSCTAHDSIMARYDDDAGRLALKRIYDDNLIYTDSIIIPQEYSDSILWALIAVYNATDLPARDTVIEMYEIHTFPGYELHNLRLSADSTLPWMQNLRNYVIPSGNTKVDSLMTLYDLYIDEYSTNYGYFRYHTVTLKSDISYNLYALADIFNTIPDVYDSRPIEYAGDGNNITVQFNPDYTELIYSIGWMDCPSGCNSRRYWKFFVYPDCSVEFAGSYGSNLVTSIEPEAFSNSAKIFPNPFNNVLFVDELLPGPGADYSIYNLMGQKVNGGSLKGNTITGLDKLSPGQYFLILFSDNYFITRKIIKH